MHKNELTKIETMIYLIRGQKVMFDADLAELYGVLTKNLLKAVKRNKERFPEDFIFQLSKEEFVDFYKQNETSHKGHGGRRTLPFAFTEAGVAMLSGVLTSDRAAQVNVSIMRTFIMLRSFLAIENSLPEKVSKLEQGTNKLFKVVFERLDNLEEQIEPKLDPHRRKIGIEINKKS